MAGTFPAFISRYESLTGVPPQYPFDTPTADGATQILPPYSVINDDGTLPNYDFEHTVIEVSNFTILTYAASLQALDAFVEIIKYNGGGTTEGLGMDFGNLPELTTPYTELVVLRTSEKNFLARPTGNVGQRIYGCELKYQVTVHLK